MSDSDWLDEFWGDILSEEPTRIVAAWLMLSPEEQEAIHLHLIKMTTESGWAEVQKAAAQAALDAIDDDEIEED